MSRLGNRRCVVKHARLGLEVLGERVVPATVIFSGGNLTISSPIVVSGSSNLQVTETSPGLFSVMDSTHTDGSYRVTGNITITSGNVPATIDVTLDDGGTPQAGDLLGSLSIYGGNGADNITVDGTSGTESIRGNLYIDGGYGNDTINVGTTNGLTIRGSATIIGNLGNDSVTLGNGTNPSTIRGGLDLYSTQNATIVNTTVLGASLDTLQTSPTNSSFEFSTLSLTIEDSSALGGQLTVDGGSLTNFFLFDDTSTLGRTIISAPGTNNTLVLESMAVNGNFTYTSGNGNNLIAVAGGAAIYPFGTDAGNLTINLGNGTNTYDFGSFLVSGNMTLTAGNSDQDVTSFGGTVQGLLSISWGTGANVFVLDTGSAAAIDYTLASGALSNAIYIDNDSNADGNNNITITVPTTVGGSYNLDIYFGGNSGIPQDVTLVGGTNSSHGPSTGSILIDWNNDTATQLRNHLQGDIVVTQENI